MKNIYLVIYDKTKKKYKTIYFKTEFNKDKYKRYIIHDSNFILIEDSTDIWFTE